MKKRMFILCGIVALLAALSLLPAGATETQDIDFSGGGEVSATCPHCNEPVTWKPLNQALVDSWYTSGSSYVAYTTANGTHYYVSEDVVSLPRYMNIGSNQTLCLHLNGNTVKRGGARAFGVEGKLRIMDHKANEGVVQAYAEKTSTGCVIRLNKASAVVHMYGGTVKMLTVFST